MDQGVLECLKRKYRRRLLNKTLDGDDLRKSLKEVVDMLDVILRITESRKEVEELTIIKFLRKLLDHRESEVWLHPYSENVEHVDIDRVETAEENTNEHCQLLFLLQRVPECKTTNVQDIRGWLVDDQNLNCTDDNIMRLVRQECNNKDGESDAEPLTAASFVTHAEDFEIIQKSLNYIENQPHTSFANSTNFRRWRDYVEKQRMTKVR